MNTAAIKSDPFKLVAPVVKLVVECPCGCGALTDAPFKGHLWVAAKDDALYFGTRKGFHAWLLRMVFKLRPPDQGGRVRIVVMKRGRLILAEPGRLTAMSTPADGPNFNPRAQVIQQQIDSLAGYHLAQPPPGVSVVGYTGPLVAADPPNLPSIQALMLAASRWTLSD